MGMGYALTEKYELENGIPKSKYGTLGLLAQGGRGTGRRKRSSSKRKGASPAGGAIGIGEITSIPTAPAVAGAYYQFNGDFQTSLPLKNTLAAKKAAPAKAAPAK